MAFFPAAVATTANLYTAVNSLQTTLATGLGTGDTSVVLASATGFPTAGAVTIGNEVIFYTNVSGATLTGCTRGADGTTAATHSVGVPVGASIVAFHHNGLVTEVIAVETFLNTKFGTSGSAYTTSRALQTNSSSGIPEVSSVTNTELGYLSGVSSAIQTQLGTKAPAASPTFTGTVTMPGGPFFVSTGFNMTTGFTLNMDAGTALSPAIQWGSGVNLSGVYSDAANTLKFVTGRTLMMTINSGDVTLSDTGSGLIWTRSTYDSYAWQQAGSGFKLRNTTDGRDEITCDQAGGIGIHGTVSNTSAAAGFVGEVAQSAVTFTNFPTSTQYGDLTSISLTAGDWIIYAQMAQIQNGATVGTATLGISTTSGNSGTGLVDGDSQTSFVPCNTASGAGSGFLTKHVQLSATTTHYLKYTSSYTVATPQAAGKIMAVRIR